MRSGAANDAGASAQKIWDAARARGVTLRRLHGSLLGVALDARGTLALSGSADRTAQLWKIADGALLQTWTHDADVRLGRAYRGGADALTGTKLDRGRAAGRCASLPFDEDGFREETRKGSLARPTRTGEEIRVRHAVSGNRVTQCLHDMLLTDDFGPSLRAVLAVKGLGHYSWLFTVGGP